MRIIQRFGRIDRIGSRNQSVWMINYWPTKDMEVYLRLQSRVQARMALADATASGDDDPLNEDPAEQIQMELNFRDEQLNRMREEVLDLDELSDGVVMSDFTLDYFFAQLLRYLEQNKAELEAMPYGAYAVTDGDSDAAQPGVIFFLRQRNPSTDKREKRASPIHPYYAVYIRDNDTKEALIAEDPRSADIIKPVLRGRDIQRYRAQWAGLWLIDTHNGYGSIPAVDIDEYPAIKNHLGGFYPQLKKRQDKGRTPYNLRNCAYHEVFDEEKLVWIELVENGRFAYDDSGIYCEATTFMMTGKHLKYLCAVLNAKLVRWFLQQIAPTSGMGTLRWKKIYVEIIPIPKSSVGEQAPLIELVDHILTAKATDPKADVSATEDEIDLRVCELYGLTATEISAVEERSLL